MIKGAPLAAAVPLRNISADGVSNKYGGMTQTPTEVELGPGYWAVASSVRYKMQVNTEPGQGMGAHPVVRMRQQWRPVYVPPGEVRYLVIAAYISITTAYMANKIDGVA